MISFEWNITLKNLCMFMIILSPSNLRAYFCCTKKYNFTPPITSRNGKTISNHKRHESVNHGEFRIAKPIIGYIKSIIVIDSTTPSIRPWSRLGTSYNAIFGVSCTPCMLAPNGIIFFIIPYKISLWSALMYGCWIFNIRVISCKHSIYKFW